MADALEALVPEVFECLCSGLSLKDLLASRAISHVWQERIRKASSSWMLCCRERFGAEAARHANCIEAFQQLRRAEKRVMSTWRDGGNLDPESMFVFSSYVRSWASDDLLLVAGLYDGTIQALQWESGMVKKPFRDRHQDEVICIDLSKDYILSGSGDPGYYGRPASDSSVKLWRRADGQLLGSLGHHSDSVRGVVLLPSTPTLDNLGLSAGLDQTVHLLSLKPFQSIMSLELPGACRSLCVVTPRWRPLLGSEVRVLASAGHQIVELVVRVSLSGAAPSLSILGQICLRGNEEPISGLSFYTSPTLWERVPVGAEYPAVLLNEEGMWVAGGTLGAEVWIFDCGTAASGGSSRRAILSSRARGSSEVISVELLNSKLVLAMSRSGRMCLVAETDTDDRLLRVQWNVEGFRMYVSTIKRREPLLLVSDGFDNAIRTIRVRTNTGVDAESEDG